MTLQNEELVEHGDNPASGKFAVNVIFREHTEDGATYVVAECMEIPGCVSEGNTKQEAAANLEAAMKLCLGVLFEDCVRRIAAGQQMPDLRGITSQERLCVDATPQLQYA